MSNKTFRAFTEKLGNITATNFVANEGELFYDPTTTTLRIGDGVTAGGQVVSGEGGAELGDITFDGVEIRGIPTEMKSGLIKLVPTPDAEGYSFLDNGQYVQIYPTNQFDAPHIHIAAGNGTDSEGDIFLGDDSKYVQVNHNGEVSIQSYNSEFEETHRWVFKADSTLEIPGDIFGTSTINIDNTDSGRSADINLYAADDISIVAGNQPYDVGSEGGDINIGCGNGSDAGVEESGGGGGDLTITSGAGGASSTSYDAGDGGSIAITAGNGGVASADGSRQAGSGSNLNITAGSAGYNDGNAALGNYGGDVILTAGDSSDEDGGGRIFFNSGVDNAGTPGDYSFGTIRSTPLTYKEAIAALAFTPVTLTTLGAASAVGAGARAFVTNGNLEATGNFGAIISDGGANTVPVFSDGTNWRIG